MRISRREQLQNPVSEPAEWFNDEQKALLSPQELHRRLREILDAARKNTPGETSGELLAAARREVKIYEAYVKVLEGQLDAVRVLYSVERLGRQKESLQRRAMQLDYEELVSLYNLAQHNNKVALILLEILQQQANRDELTGLMNRRGFMETVQKFQKKGIGGTLVLLDLDKFKEVNDCFGHHVGDNVLVACGNELRGLSRATQIGTIMRRSELGQSADAQETERRDTVEGRPGGEEMALFIPDMDPEEFMNIIRERAGGQNKIHVELPFKFSEFSLVEGAGRPQRPDDYVAFSGAIARIGHNDEVAQVFQRLDKKGLYKAKQNGRDQILLLDESNNK